MRRNIPLAVALIVSVLIHGLFLFFLPQAMALKERKFLAKEIEVTYKRLQIEALKERLSLAHDKQNLSPKISGVKDISSKVRALEPPIFKEKIFTDLKIIQNKEPVLPKLSLAKKKVSLPEVAQPAIKNPVYLSYYQEIRSKIKHFAYGNYTRLEKGEVYLTFVIASDGSLKDVKILDDKSTDSPYLKEISRKSLEESMPYPNFPKELNYPQLSFNVIISYEVD